MLARTLLRPTFLLILISFWFGQHSLHAQVLESTSGVVEQLGNSGLWQPATLNASLESSQLRSFQGNADIRLSQGNIKLAPFSKLEFQEEGMYLHQGKLYLEGEGLSLLSPLPIIIEGKARLDLLEAGYRIGILEGSVELFANSKSYTIGMGQQIIFPHDASFQISNYFEYDPWYEKLFVIAKNQGLIVALAGQVEFSLAENNWQTASLHLLVGEGQRIRTADQSWVEIRFDDTNLIRLQANTELELSRLDRLDSEGEFTVLKLVYGRVWVVIENQGEPFQIETPGLITGARGTTFRVDSASDDNLPFVKTFEGTVFGAAGFAVEAISAGEAFDKSGRKPLTLDQLDLFNLYKDRIEFLDSIGYCNARASCLIP